MTRAIADTSVFLAREADHGLDEAGFPEELAVSVITIGELRAGSWAHPTSPRGIDVSPRSSKRWRSIRFRSTSRSRTRGPGCGSNCETPA